MVWNTQDAEEQDERASGVTAKTPPSYMLAGTLVLGLPFGFLVLFLIGPTVIADSLFFWPRRQVLRKQLVSGMVPIVAHIVHRRRENSRTAFSRKYFVKFGYQMDKVSYVTKNEIQVSEALYARTTAKQFLASSTYPASGPFYSAKYAGNDDDLCSACCRFFFFALFTAFATFFLGTFILGPIAGARTILNYFRVAGGLELAGILIAAYYDSYWRNNTLYACQVVNELLPALMIDDEEGEDNNAVGLEMGMRAVQEDDDTETLVLTEEYETDLESYMASVI